MAFLCLPIEELTTQQAWFLIGNTNASFLLLVNLRPYVCVPIGFLMALYTKPLQGLGGGQRRRSQILRQILRLSYKRTITYNHSSGTDIEVEDLADTTAMNATSVIKLDLVNPSNNFMNRFCCQGLKIFYGQVMQEAAINTFSILRILVQSNQGIKPSNSQSLKPSHLLNALLHICTNGTSSLHTSSKSTIVPDSIPKIDLYYLQSNVSLTITVFQCKLRLAHAWRFTFYYTFKLWNQSLKSETKLSNLKQNKTKNKLK